MIIIYDIKANVDDYSRIKRRFYYHLNKLRTLNPSIRPLTKSCLILNESSINDMIGLFKMIGIGNVEFFIIYYESIVSSAQLPQTDFD